LTVYKIPPEDARKVINNIIFHIKSKGWTKLFTDSFTVIPSSIVICYPDRPCFYYYELPEKHENVFGVKFDVIGLHPKFATLVEVYTDGTVVVSPGLGRSKGRVHSLLDRLKSLLK